MARYGLIGRAKLADEHFRNRLRGAARDEGGQSTVEYAIVFAVGIAIIGALGLLMNAVGDGMFVEHAVSSASHCLDGAIGGVADVFSY